MWPLIDMRVNHSAREAVQWQRKVSEYRLMNADTARPGLPLKPSVRLKIEAKVVDDFLLGAPAEFEPPEPRAVECCPTKVQGFSTTCRQKLDRPEHDEVVRPQLP